MEGKLIIPIEADISQFKASFAEANKIVSDFNAQLGRSGATTNLFSDNSISALLNRIGELEIKLDKLKKQFDELKTSTNLNINPSVKSNIVVKEVEIIINSLNQLKSFTDININPTISSDLVRNQIGLIESQLIKLKSFDLNLYFNADSAKVISEQIKVLENRLLALKSINIDNIGSGINTDKVTSEIKQLEDEILKLQTSLKINASIDSSTIIKDVNNIIDSLNQLKSITDININPTISADAVKNQISLIETQLNKLKSINLNLYFNADGAKVIINQINAIEARLLALKSINIDNIGTGFNTDKVTAEVKQLENELLKLQASLSSISNTGGGAFDSVTSSSRKASKAVKDVADPAAKAKQSLTALSLVAQDLPFGFIAIQNNLPNLIQYFGELRTQSKESGGSLKYLKEALIGSAGVYLAFSLVTAAVTKAIKEYGSFENAVNALFGTLDPLYKVIDRAAKSFEEYNKNAITAGEATAKGLGSVQGDIIKVETLSNAVLDLSNSEQIRKNALSQLQTIDKERFANFDVEKGKLDGLKKATEEYTDAIIANGVAKQFEQQAVSAATNYETQKNVYNQFKSQLQEQEKLFPGVAEKAKKYKEVLAAYNEEVGKFGITRLAPTTTDEVNKYIKLSSNADEALGKVKLANTELEKTKELYKQATLEANKFYRIPTEKEKQPKAPKDFRFIPEESLIGINSIDNVIGKVADYADVILDVNKKTSERVAAVNELKQVDIEYFKNLDLSNMKYSEINDIITQYIHNLRVLQLEQAGAAAAAKLQQQATENLAEAEKKIQADFEKRTAQDIQFNQPKFTPFKTIELWSSLFKFDKKNADKSYNELIAELNVLYERLKTGLQNPMTFTNEEFNSILKSINEVFQGLDKNMDSVESKIESALRKPFEDFFTEIIENGKVSFNMFKEFAINALKQIAAKLLALGVAKLITSILNPEGTALKTATKGGGSIMDILGTILGGAKPSQANFSGLQGGGMQLAGEVVFVQRGTELVGVLNRTNASINRVG